VYCACPTIAIAKIRDYSQTSGEVPSPSVLKKAKLWNDSVARNCWRNAGETLKMIHVQAHRKVTDNDLKEIDTIPDMRRLFLLF